MLNFTLPFPLRHKIRADKKKHHLSECSRHAPRSYRITVGNCQLHEQLEMEKRSMKIHTTNVFLHLIPPNFTSGFSETCLPPPPPFWRVRKNCEEQLLPSSCPSICPTVCLQAWNNSAPTGRIFTSFDI